MRVHHEKRSGCDTVSYFVGKGKKTAFQGWKSSVSYHLLKIRSMKKNVMPWSDLWLSCIAVRVPTRPSTKLDKFCLPKVTKALKIFLRLKPLLHSISKEQPIRPVMYGVKRWSLCRNSQIRQSGVGSNHQRDGLPSGLR